METSIHPSKWIMQITQKQSSDTPYFSWEGKRKLGWTQFSRTSIVFFVTLPYTVTYSNIMVCCRCSSDAALSSQARRCQVSSILWTPTQLTIIGRENIILCSENMATMSRVCLVGCWWNIPWKRLSDAETLVDYPIHYWELLYRVWNSLFL